MIPGMFKVNIWLVPNDKKHFKLQVIFEILFLRELFFRKKPTVTFITVFH